MHDTSQFINKLRAMGCNPTKGGKGWVALCPAHDDKNPSLAVYDNDGHPHVVCFAGCTKEDVYNSMDLKMIKKTTKESTKPSKPQKKQGLCRRSQGKVYSKAKDALNAIKRRLKSKRSGLWEYRNEKGKLIGLVVRFDKTVAGETHKEFRPISKLNKGWVIEAMPCPRPLYQLPDLIKANRVYITEGEKAADAVSQLGLTATASSNGSQSPSKTDWSSLDGKECVILPDNDEAGEKYSEKVINLLAKLSPTTVVKIVRLPDLPEKGDSVEWIEANSEIDPNDLKEELEQLANDADRIAVDSQSKSVAKFKPFPTHVLPKRLKAFVKSGAKATGCDESYFALPLLTIIAAAIGNSWRLKVKSSWKVPAILWTAIVGESGTVKSAALAHVMSPINKLQEELLSNKQLQTNESEEPKSNATELTRLWVGDTTVEALVSILKDNLRGLLVYRDEISGWITSFDKYAGSSKGDSDSSFWLSIYSGSSISVDRKTGEERTICIPMASVSITGSIQPGTLYRLLKKEHRDSGLAARILMANPPRKTKKWSDVEISEQLIKNYEKLIRKLYTLKPKKDGNGTIIPNHAVLSDDAFAIWTTFYDQHNKEMINTSGDLAAAYSKLEELPLRLALILHFARWATREKAIPSRSKIDINSLKAAIEITEWFKYEIKRIYDHFSEDKQERENRKYVDWIERKGGRTTVRDFQLGINKIRSSTEAEKVLNELREKGYGYWEQSKSGKSGRPTRYFVLF